MNHSLIMGSHHPNLEQCRQELDEHGYCLISKEEFWGQKVDQIIDDGYRPNTEHALSVLAQSTYENEVGKSS